MHYAIVTETYPPQVNGVARTVRALEQGLRAGGHRVTLAPPRQPGERHASGDAVRVAGLPLPLYSGLGFGMPAAGLLRRHWRTDTSDAIYVATEGPLGWSAVRAARVLGVPVATGLHTRFERYMREYGLGVDAPVPQPWRCNAGADARTRSGAFRTWLPAPLEDAARGRHPPFLARAPR